MNTRSTKTPLSFEKHTIRDPNGAPYLLELLQTGRRHVRVPSEFGASRGRQSGAEAADLASALAAKPRVAVPPLESLEDRNLEQRIGRFLRHDRLVPGRELPPAHAAPPRRLQEMILNSIVIKIKRL